MIQKTFDQVFNNIQQYITKDFQRFSIKQENNIWSVKITYSNREEFFKINENVDFQKTP